MARTLGAGNGLFMLSDALPGEQLRVHGRLVSTTDPRISSQSAKPGHRWASDFRFDCNKGASFAPLTQADQAASGELPVGLGWVGFE